MKSDAENEKTSGKAELYFMAYELTELQNDNSAICIYENKSLWKFKPSISFNALAIDLTTLNNSELDLNVLKYFASVKDELENVIYLTDLVKMTKKLQKHLQKKIFKEYATQTTLQECLESNLFDIKVQRSLLDEFRKYAERLENLWSKAKYFLKEFLSKKELLTHLTTSFDHVFDMNTKLSYFLPSKYGDGFVCYALIKYLSFVHNNFMESYLAHCQRQELELDIFMFDNPEYIIQFNSKGSLLRLIESYQEFDSKNSKIIFHYEKIQQKLIENFIQSKPLIDIKSIEKSIIFEYSNEMNDIDEVLFRLDNEIKQELVDEGTQKAIYDEFKQINETSEALHVLKTIINFACTTWNNSDEKLSEFVKKVFPQDSSVDSILKAKITETCKLKHLKHVWLIIMMKRAVLFTSNGQEPFEMLQKDFRIETDAEFTLPVNSLTFVSIALVFYQFIIRFIYQIKQQDVNSFKTYLISDVLYEIGDNESGRAQIEFPNNTSPEDFSRLLSSNLTLEHSFFVWKYIAQTLTKLH